jgi:hypothetical protein
MRPWLDCRGKATFQSYPSRINQVPIFYLSLYPSLGRWYELNITESTIADNSGRGVAIEHMRSQLDISGSSISNNQHVAGVHVLYGTGHVNISHSRISFNKGDGVNISFTGEFLDC